MPSDSSASDNRYLPPPGNASSRALDARRADGQIQPWNSTDAAFDDDDDVIDLRELWRIVLKHKWLLLSATLAGLLAALLVSFVRTPIYQASTSLQINKRAAQVVRFGDDFGGEAELDDRTGIGTQMQLLSSRTLAERVIDQLHLNRSGAFDASLPVAEDDDAPGAAADPSAQDAGEPGWLERIRDSWNKLRQPSLDSQRLLDREAVIGAFRNTVTLEQERNSRVIKLSVANPDPRLAARIANTMAEEFIALNLERRLQASSYAKSFLEQQLGQTKARLEESERRLNDYARDHHILTLGDKASVTDQTYTEFAAALAKAEQERIKYQSEYNAIKSAPNTARQVLENATIQNYKAQRSLLAAEYQQNSKKYKDGFPLMVQLRAQMQDLDAKINAEIAGILRSVQNELVAAQSAETELRQRVAQTRTEIVASRDDQVGYNLLLREVDTNRELYDGLLQQVKEVGVAGGVETNNIQVIDKAQVPLFPFKPKISLNAAIGLLAGLLAGLMTIFLMESLDDSIKSVEDVEKSLMLPLLGVVPKVREKGGYGNLALQALADPRGHLAEAYRSVRTALQFSSSAGAPQQLVVTSTTQGEGKTTTAIALAINFAQLGHRVVLIDGDMRKPQLHTTLGLDNSFGLSSLLSGQRAATNILQGTDIKNLAIITAGPVPPSPVDLLMGARLPDLLGKLKKAGFDYVIFDGPPVLGLADAIVLGNQVDAMLFVVQASRTRKRHIASALQRLHRAGVAPLGVVLTKTTAKNTAYYADESYYGYGAGEGIKASKHGMALDHADA